jgi:hypothetical protein
MLFFSVRRILDALNTLLRTDSKSHNIGAAEVFGRLIIKEDNEHHLISYGQKVRVLRTCNRSIAAGLVMLDADLLEVVNKGSVKNQPEFRLKYVLSVCNRTTWRAMAEHALQNPFYIYLPATRTCLSVCQSGGQERLYISLAWLLLLAKFTTHAGLKIDPVRLLVSGFEVSQ